MYRSQQLFKTIDTLIPDEDIYPICVPSFRRPEATILKALEREPDLPIVLFIRAEEKDLYKAWKGKCRIVLLYDVHNIGQTRAKVVEWAWKHRVPDIFMLDDDIDELDYLYPHETKNGTVCMRCARQNTDRPWKGINKKTFKMWMWWIENSDHPSLSSLSYRPDSWHMKNENADVLFNSSACIQCVHIDTKKLYRHKINYRDTELCGNEDYALQFDVMESGLRTAMFKDLMYGCPAVGSVSGGCENASGISDLQKRYRYYVRLFLKNVADESHPGVRLKTTKSGFTSIAFDWKYWRGKR